MAIPSHTLMRPAQSAFNSAAVRFADPDTMQAAKGILAGFSNLNDAHKAIAEDVAPVRR